MLTSQGETYNGSNIDKSSEKLTLMMAEQGVAFAASARAPRPIRPRARSLSSTPSTKDRGSTSSASTSRGNLRTKDYVIRREFRLAEGDAYNPLLVDRAKKRLQGLGFFKAVDIKRRPGSAPDRVILDVELLEQSTGELSFGAGYSTSEGVIGDVSITERNLLGNGQFLRLKLGGSLERLQVDLSFTEPRFLDRNLSAGFDLFHKEVDQTDEVGLQHDAHGRHGTLGLPVVREPVDADRLYAGLQHHQGRRRAQQRRRRLQRRRPPRRFRSS